MLALGRVTEQVLRTGVRIYLMPVFSWSLWRDGVGGDSGQMLTFSRGDLA